MFQIIKVTIKEQKLTILFNYLPNKIRKDVTNNMIEIIISDSSVKINILTFGYLINHTTTRF